MFLLSSFSLIEHMKTFAMRGPRIVLQLPFKDQRSANAVRKDLSELTRKLEEICDHCLLAEKLLMISKMWRPNLPLLTNIALFINFHVICVIRIMSNIHPDISFNTSLNINILLLVTT